MSSSFSSMFSNTPSFTMEITDDEFNAFHKGDRTLFSRLVFGLNRDRNQSFQVLGFLLVLEQTGYARDLIAFLVLSPDSYIESLANEVGVCLSFLCNQDVASTFFASNTADGSSMIPSLMQLTGSRLTLRMIHQDRENFLQELTKKCKGVCARAFKDLMQRAAMLERQKLVAMEERDKLIEEMRRVRLGVQQETRNRLSAQQVTIPTHPPALAVGEEANMVVGETVTTRRVEEETRMTADDRTVFLTFSKGYPISEEEVRVYFTRRFGEVIEGIEMQEVEENEQPLYAKMVLKMQYASKMEEIVNGRSRNKFTIDGKHVWARKFVPRNP